MAWISATVFLTKDTTSKTSKNNKQFSTGYGFLNIDGQDGLGVSLISFGNAGTELARYKKGDSIHITGVLKENRWQPPEGEEVVGLQIIVEGIGGRKRISGVQNEVPKKKSITPDQAQAAHTNFNQINPDLNDDINF